MNKSSKSSGPVFTHAGDSGPNKPQGCRRRFAGLNLNVSQCLPFPVPFQSFGEFLDGEIVQDLWPKLIGSPHKTSFFAGSTGEYNQGSIYCVMIFDTNTGKLVSNQGYAIVDSPAKGQVARFGNYVARFIGIRSLNAAAARLR